MKEAFLHISEQNIIEFLLIGILLFVGLRIVQKGLKRFTGGKTANSVFNRFFPIFEFTLWVFFLMLGARQIFPAGIVGSALLLAALMGLFAWAGSFVVRDWIAGIIFKTEDRYRVDDIVNFQNTRGRLMDLGYRSLTIEASDGRTVEIPYSALAREGAIEKIPRETACAVFTISVPIKEPFPEIQHQIQTVALCAPWTSFTRKPCIRIIERLESCYIVEVAAHMIDQRYAPEVEAYLSRHFSKKYNMPAAG